jgi:hypothetical protein
MKQQIMDNPVVALFTGLLGAVIAVLVAFGVVLTAPQIAALTGLVAAAIPVVAFVRSKVTPNHKI